MQAIESTTIDICKNILLNNNRDGYTIPSARLYPFQWNWDSGFIALGLMHINPQLAMDEVINMFNGQWKNGMLPHINFHKPDPNYFPGPDVWNTSCSQYACDTLATSGITQPPVFGFILNRMDLMHFEKPDNWLSFLKTYFDKTVLFHQYLYENRDPNKEGLVYIHHNWESGTDNSPVWDSILYSIDVSDARDVSALRRDIKNVDASQRPTNDHYKRYIYLVDLFIKHQYNDASIRKECPFLVQDVLFNSLLAKSNEGLIQLADRYGWDKTIIENWQLKTLEAIQTKLWDEQSGFYYAYDLCNNQSIKIKTSSGFLPLFAGIATSKQSEKLIAALKNDFVANEDWILTPSTAFKEPTFDPVKYWRGPVWINVNWMIYHGLMRYGYLDLAMKIKQQSIQLLETQGIYEYFDPRPIKEGGSKVGLGGDAFSWSAALYLDFLFNAATL